MKNSLLSLALAAIAVGAGLGAGIKTAVASTYSCQNACYAELQMCLREVGSKSYCYAEYVACKSDC